MWRRVLSSQRRATSSGELPPAPEEAPFVSIGFYNVGIQNNEVNGRNWDAKCERLKSDIKKIFRSDHCVQALFILEFGSTC